MRIRVVLPAPFGPRTPSTVPAGTDRLTPRRACVDPKERRRSLATIAWPPALSARSMSEIRKDRLSDCQVRFRDCSRHLGVRPRGNPWARMVTLAGPCAIPVLDRPLLLLWTRRYSRFGPTARPALLHRGQEREEQGAPCGGRVHV